MKEKIFSFQDRISLKQGDRLELADGLLKKKRSEISDEKTEIEPLESFEELNAEESDYILDNLEIHGDGLKGAHLSLEDIRNAGQEPKSIVNIGGRRIAAAGETYQFKDRSCITLFVKEGKKFIPRTYYLSNSSASWRYLPEYTLDEKGDISWFGKGYEEQSLNAPYAVQKQLAQLNRSEDRPEPANPELIFAGTTRLLDYRKRSDESYYQSVESAPTELRGRFRIVEDRDFDPNATMYGIIKKIAPENINFGDGNEEPDFSSLVDRWIQQSGLYGNVEISIFPSYDGKIRYMISTDESGRTWLFGAEKDSPIGANGLRKSWLNLWDLATPAYEYPLQAGNYGNYDLKSGEYVDMYEKYTSRIPLIREYLAAKKSKI